MLNFEAVSAAIDRIKAHVARRHITLSTCGIDLERLHAVPYNVAVSLHSPFQEVRERFISFGRVDDIVNFTQVRPVMIEYSLIAGVNDRECDLQKLLSLEFGSETNFNLIRLNDHNGYTGSDGSWFKEEIRKKGYKCFIRYPRGCDIQAACGMLSPQAASPRTRMRQSRVPEN